MPTTRRSSTVSDAFPTIIASTLVVVRTGPSSGRVVGQLTFASDIRLVVAEVVDFDAGTLETLDYSYEVHRGEEKLYWYDAQPHPNDRSLANTHPHHKHIPPDIKHHRILAAELSFADPNLPTLIQEIETTLL